MMLWLRSLVFDGLFYALMALMGVLGAPLVFFSRAWTRGWMRLFCRISFWLLERLCGLRVEVRGDVPQGDVIVGSGHQSFLDILLLMSVLPKPRFVMKSSLLWMPVFGQYAQRIGALPIQRAEGTKSLRKLQRAFADAPGQIVIYPQGTRAEPGAPLTLKPGIALLYDELERPCIPAATNTGLFWPRHARVKRPGLAVLTFLEPIAPGQPRRAFLSKLQLEIATGEVALLREAGVGG